MVWWLDTSILKEHSLSALRVISAQDRGSMVFWYMPMTEITISKIGFEYMKRVTSFVSFVSSLKIIGHGNLDNYLESLCIIFKLKFCYRNPPITFIIPKARTSICKK
jgi:hypothetical protein